MARTASIERETSETKIQLSLDLDGAGTSQLSTGVGFFDHMLTLWSRHSLIDLDVRASGDLHVDSHHVVEDVGICLGQAIREALGDKKGIRRYGHALLPMDESLVSAAIDLSGRSYLHFGVAFPAAHVGTFDTELVEEFWRAVSQHLACNLHLELRHGRNTHHIAEGVFKAAAQAFRMAVEFDPRSTARIPSTKGQL